MFRGARCGGEGPAHPGEESGGGAFWGGSAGSWDRARGLGHRRAYAQCPSSLFSVRFMAKGGNGDHKTVKS